jgi:hypothetical protein
MNCDKTRINRIENILKNNPDSISNNDLIYYLKCNSNNQILDDINLKNTEEYLKKINNSFFFENIFINTSNYTSIVPLIIGLLIPFYYFYPRFYNIGFLGTSIGFISFFSLYFKVTGLYENFFNKIGLIFIGLSFMIYIIFFIVLNKLNHVSLFFISVIIAYLIINYISRIILTLPIKKNIYNQFRANMNDKTSSNYTEYNVLLETACYLVINRYQLKLPSGLMLYSYLSEFEIGDNSTLYTDFFTNLLGPIISLFILWLLSYLLNLFKDNNLGNSIDLFPLIGMNNNSMKYISCQANYILPKELNVGLLIHECIDKYDFDNKIYGKVEKALLRISKELLIKYNPKFVKIENDNKNSILSNLKDNKIYIEIIKILKRNNIDFNIDYLDEIKDVIKKEEIPYKIKYDMYQLLEHINNVLFIDNKVNESYENDSFLARDELLYDKEIDESYKDTLKNILNKYIKNFTDNLNLKNNTLFGYHYNIITYSLFNNKTRIYSNKIFKHLLRFISTWLLLAKPIGSSWLLVKYMLLSYTGVKKLLKKFSSDSIIWKYFTMGMDTSYFEDVYNKNKNNNDNSIIKKGLNLLYTALIFIFILPIIYMYNSITFGFTSSPSWYNLLYQVVFILNIIGNISCYVTKKSHLMFNIIFIVVFIIIMIVISVVSYMISKK